MSGIAAEEFKFRLANRITAIGVVGEYEISGESKIRFAVENATGGNTVVVSGKIFDQTAYTTIITLNGNDVDVADVSTYDQIKVEVTVYGSAGDHVQVIASSFNEASGSASIGVPAGGTVTGDPIQFTSTGLTVAITQTGPSTINFEASGGGGNAFGTMNAPLGTDPVATTGADTLNWTSSDSNVLITGNSGTKTMDLALATNVTSNLYRVEKFTLSAGDITNKYVTIAQAPVSASKTRFTIIGGVEQDYSVDFTVAAAQVGWNALGLDGVLVSGDKVIVIYS